MPGEIAILEERLRVVIGHQSSCRHSSERKRVIDPVSNESSQVLVEYRRTSDDRSLAGLEVQLDILLKQPVGTRLRIGATDNGGQRVVLFEVGIRDSAESRLRRQLEIGSHLENQLHARIEYVEVRVILIAHGRYICREVRQGRRRMRRAVLTPLFITSGEHGV